MPSGREVHLLVVTTSMAGSAVRKLHSEADLFLDYPSIWESQGFTLSLSSVDKNFKMVTFMQNLTIKYSVLKFFVSIQLSKQNVLSSFSFPHLPLRLSEMLHFEHKTVFLNHCNNQKNYSSVYYNIKEKEIEMQLIFIFLDI